MPAPISFPDGSSEPLEADSFFSKQAAANAEKSLNNALVPAQNLQKDLTVRAKNVSNTLVKFTGARQVHIEKTIGVLQAVSQCICI